MKDRLLAEACSYSHQLEDLMQIAFRNALAYSSDANNSDISGQKQLQYSPQQPTACIAQSGVEIKAANSSQSPIIRQSAEKVEQLAKWRETAQYLQHLPLTVQTLQVLCNPHYNLLVCQ